jgi:RNA polymerase sigma-70 factor (ECF subfamily)
MSRSVALRETPLTVTAEHSERLVAEGARRLLERATNSRSLDVVALSGRLSKTLQKYLLKDDPGASDQAVSELLDSVKADDLCLIVACERGDESAWNDLVEGYGATVRSAARSASSNEDAAEDLAQSIWAELHGLKQREDGRAVGKLSYYSGVGSLGGWLRAVVGQLAVDQHRKQSRLVQTEEEPEMDRLSRDSDQSERMFGAALNPEDALEGKVAGAEVEAALGRAIAELTTEDRLLVKLYYFDGLRLREAGAVLGVHEATASRRLTRVHSDLRQRVAGILMTEQGWTKSETDRSLAEVTSRLEVDLEPLVSAPAMDAN